MECSWNGRDFGDAGNKYEAMSFSCSDDDALVSMSKELSLTIMVWYSCDFWSICCAGTVVSCCEHPR